MRFFPLFALSAMVLASCSTPSGRIPKDSWGNRSGPRGFSTVVLDAGHGGHDSGARSSSTQMLEKDLALDVAQRTAQLLRGRIHVELLREGDAFIDLDQRVSQASAAGDVLVSIHFNHGPSSLSGAETFYWRVDSHGLAVRLQHELSKVAPPRGSRGLVRRRLRLTRNPSIPSVLVECGYLSNPGEANRIAQPSYRQSLAQALANAILAQATNGDAGTGPLPPPLWEPLSKASDPRQ